MTRFVTLSLVLGILGALLAGCSSGPGYTRAAGTVGGTTAGALLGAALSPDDRGGGAAVGAIVGLVGGTMAGEAIAQDQERYGWCRECGKAGGCEHQEFQPPCEPPPCAPCAAPRTRVVRQGTVRYYREAPPPPPREGWYYYGPNPPPGY